MSDYLRHHVMEMDESLVQRCVVCGYEVTNLNGAMYCGDGPPPRGFAEGEVFISKKGNPTIFLTTAPDGEWEDCKP